MFGFRVSGFCLKELIRASEFRSFKLQGSGFGGLGAGFRVQGSGV